MKKDTIVYRGFEIQMTPCTTRFGTLYHSANNIGEPYMEQIAYRTRQQAVDAAKKDIDTYIEEQ